MSLERRDLQEGFNLIRQRRLEEAREFFYEALRLDPDDADAHFGLGCVYAAMGEKDQAVEEWRRCLELDPEMGEAHYALAWAYYDAGDYETGFRHVEMAYSSGVSLQPLKELFNLFVKTGKPVAERAEEPKEREKTKPTRDLIIHVVCSIALFILCYFLLKGTLHEGYPHDYLDATVAFYIAKIRILLSNGFRLYTPVWYFGYELLRFYPPLSTIIPYIAVRLTGNLLTTYYTLCLIYYALYVIGTYLFASRFLSSPISGILAAVIWSITHANIISFQGHYWETARLMGTALVPWVLYFVERALAEGRKRYMVASIITASYVLLSSMLSAIDLLILLIPFLLIRGGLAPHDPEPERYSVPERMGRLIIWGVEGLLGLTLWWYIPAIFPHGIGVFLSVGKGRPLPLTHVLFQLHPPSWMTGIQLPITLLGLIGALLTIILQDRRGATPTIWFLSTTAIAYIIGLQGWRLILNIGFSLALLSAFTIKTLEEQIEYTKKGMGRWIAFTLTLLICGLLLYSYLPTYASYAVVDNTYRSTDEYLTATWLADHLNGSYRVYVMYGDNYRGTQWLNTFEPDVKQVLGGFDQGGRAMSLEPFIFDDLIKWGTNSTEAYKKAIEHGVKYIVIDRRWMLRNSPNAYDKFSDKRLFRAVNSINDKLSYAEVYEVINATSKTEPKVNYKYWNMERIIGVILSAMFLAFFMNSILKTDNEVKEVKIRYVNRDVLDKLSTIFSLIFVISLTLFVCYYTKAIIGFPKGVDAYAHLTKIKFIVHYWPHIYWNHLWDTGVPLFGGSYPPLTYYMSAGLVKLLNCSPELSLNILSTISFCLNSIGLFGFMYNITKNRIGSLIGVSLLLLTPAYWSWWIGGGNYARVIAMGFLGLSLYLATLRDLKAKIALTIILALAVSGHLVVGVSALLAACFFILFKYNFIKGIKESIKLFLMILGLDSFYIMQILFSNPSASGILGSVRYEPTPLEVLFFSDRLDILGILLIPVFIFLIIIHIIQKDALINLPKSIKSGLASSLSLITPFFIYSIVGYIPGYPKYLYINGFPPNVALCIVSIGMSMSIGIMLGSISKERLKSFLWVLFIIVLIVGFIFHIPIMKNHLVDETKQDTMEYFTQRLIEVTPKERWKRLGTDFASIAVWFNYIYDVPQSRGYYAQGVPYPDWHGWLEYAVWFEEKNYLETNFLLDWFALKWIVVGQPHFKYEKFLSKPEYYHPIRRTNNWWEFEYLNASVILSATNAPPILFIGSRHHYDVLLRALSFSGLKSRDCIPLLGNSKYVDSYKLEELQRFPVVVLYGYDYKNQEKMSQLLSAYVAGGGCLFLEANGSPDYKAENLPDPFPVRETHTDAVVDEWSFNVSNHPISHGVNFTAFAPPLYGAGGWGVSTSYEIADWAEPILMSGGDPS